MSYFVGLTFVQHFLQFKKIDSFRRRFDYKYNPSLPLHMSILPPFELDKDIDINQIEDCLIDTIESHFFGLEDVNKVQFSNINFDFAKTSLLYLSPKLSEDFFYCQDSIKKTLKDYCVKFKESKFQGRYLKNEYQSILPLARTRNPELFQVSLDTSKQEFIFPIELSAGSVVLFEKTSTGWIQRRRLFDFPKNNNYTATNINVSGFSY